MTNLTATIITIIVFIILTGLATIVALIFKTRSNYKSFTYHFTSGILKGLLVQYFILLIYIIIIIYNELK